VQLEQVGDVGHAVRRATAREHDVRAGVDGSLHGVLHRLRDLLAGGAGALDPLEDGAVDVERDEPWPPRAPVGAHRLTGSSSSRPPSQGCSAFGTRTEPSACWWVSRIATMVLVIAHSVPLRVATGLMSWPNRPRVSRRRVWNSVQFEVEV